jgi:hypothetical protein
MARLDDGYQTTIEFSVGGSGEGIKFWEKNVTPPGMDAGGANDTTTMRNTLYRTKAPKYLITMTDMTLTVAYDPDLYSSILDMIRVNQLITINWPDGASLEFWGWLDKFTPGQVMEGAQPEATITIVPSNQNEDGEEVAPVSNVAA